LHRNLKSIIVDEKQLDSVQEQPNKDEEGGFIIRKLKKEFNRFNKEKIIMCKNLKDKARSMPFQADWLDLEPENTYKISVSSSIKVMDAYVSRKTESTEDTNRKTSEGAEFRKQIRVDLAKRWVYRRPYLLCLTLLWSD
jgi:hypothetical protein